MSRARLEAIDPIKAAERGRVIEGALEVSTLARIHELLVDHAGQIQYRLQFGREEGHCVVRGSVSAELVLECQCCLAPLHYPIESQFALGVVASPEQAKFLPEGLEPLVLDGEGMFSIAEVVEDEVLLSLPYVPQHPVCGAPDLPSAEAPDSEVATRRPFANLSSLIKSNH